MKSKYFVFVLQIGLGIKILSFSFAAFALSPTIACYEAAIHDREVLKVNKQYYENFGESGLRTIEQALVVLCAGTKSPSATINCYKEAIAKPYMSGKMSPLFLTKGALRTSNAIYY
jgi:hypothetical protein